MAFHKLIIRLFFLLTFASLHSEESPSTQVSKAKIEQTLSIIKPNAVKDHHIGKIIARFEQESLHLVAIKMILLTPEQAEQFYSALKDRSFFKDLVNFMTSGPVVVMVLEGKDAVAKNREIMGATDPKKAAKGTLRAEFAKSITENAVHGSDSSESANAEIAFFFKPEEIFNQP